MRSRFKLAAVAAAVLTSGACMANSASAALRLDGMTTAPVAAPETMPVRLDRRHRRVRHHHYREQFYGAENAPALPTGPMPIRREPAPSYCAGQFQDVSPDGLFRDNSGRIRPCF